MSLSFISPNILNINLNRAINFNKDKTSIRQYLNCNNTYTPATTNVDEWTKEEIGVGALIADKSQALKGNWALLTQPPKIKKTNPHFTILLLQISIDKTPIINKTKNKSPIRFWNKVNKPLLILSQFI
jgi:hypothetical protein